MTATETNKAAIVGFLISLIAALLIIVPFFNWILWLLGLIFSIVGIKRTKHRGWAIAGLVLSILNLVVMTMFPALLTVLLFQIN